MSTMSGMNGSSSFSCRRALRAICGQVGPVRAAHQERLRFNQRGQAKQLHQERLRFNQRGQVKQLHQAGLRNGA
eukprot:113159-Chlamydomonas_euryale.AAC.1